MGNGTNFQLWCTLYVYGQCRFTMALWWLFKSTLRCVKYLKVSNDIVHTLNIIIYATQNSTSAISKVESYILFRNSPVFEEEVFCPFFLWPLCFLSFFDLRILIIPLVSSSSSHINHIWQSQSFAFTLFETLLYLSK